MQGVGKKIANEKGAAGNCVFFVAGKAGESKSLSKWSVTLLIYRMVCSSDCW
jgi:hypothetical protein